MLHIYCAGELIRDPEQRTAKTGISYTTALVRCSDALVSVTCFDAALAAQLLALRKGDPVSVAGRLQASAYAAKDGEPRCGLAVTVSRLMAAPARSSEARRRSRPAQSRESEAAPAAAGGFDDALPF